jgi:hypothetical protein
MYDSTVKLYQKSDEDGPIFTSSKNCKQLYNIYQDIKIELFNTVIAIKPRGYLYNMIQAEDQQGCFIGIEAINDKLNEIRLGSIFLRNFYIGLDYRFN